MKPGGDRGKQGCYSVEEQEYCDDCGYKFSLGELKKFECKDCGQYLICDYCYEEYYDKINQQTGSALLESSDDSDSEISDEEQSTATLAACLKEARGEEESIGNSRK
eukprot:CAMPEP_0170488350 /NCGR_PEP_ID=MMETSP0208-20121228/6918_1 /TAXON_ID=197538 /ORGANISM="Strombidium inclinatum, Strain S3" /LENGTH=106 /DNA_ID=CAMNT_0010762895 /DNA_START=544 /DNA_END=865 /DNA_ORIENTATION=+